MECELRLHNLQERAKELQDKYRRDGRLPLLERKEVAAIAMEMERISRIQMPKNVRAAVRRVQLTHY